MTRETSASLSCPDAGPPRGSSVLVTGATGFTGSLLTRRLVARGMRVTALARPGSRTAHLADVDVTWVRGEISEEALVAEAMRGQQYVFHLAAAYRRAGLSEAEYRRVHVTSTMRLAEQAARVAGFRRFVHVSTVGVHGSISDPPANELSPLRPGDAYQRTKAAAELWDSRFRRRGGSAVHDLTPVRDLRPGRPAAMEALSDRAVGRVSGNRPRTPPLPSDSRRGPRYGTVALGGAPERGRRVVYRRQRGVDDLGARGTRCRPCAGPPRADRVPSRCAVRRMRGGV